MQTVIVVGGGAAGLIAAGFAAKNGSKVVIFEKNAKCGRKLYITGKGRCNICNDCDSQSVMANIPRNPKFLYSALEAFPPEQTKAFFEEIGVPIKTERANRVFPVSDRAADIIDALVKFCKNNGVKITTKTVENICVEDGKAVGVQVAGKVITADKVVIATGGASYPLTGSTGDGYKFASEVGHKIEKPKASLVPLVEDGKTCSELMGLSLRNVRVNVYENNKKIFTDFGEMLFTHFGLSGPIILSSSAHMRKFDKKKYVVEIDLKPALDIPQLEKRVLSDFEKYKNYDFINSLGELLPRKLIPVIVKQSGIDGHTKVHSITKQQRTNFVELLKKFRIEIKGTRPISEGIITSGGVSVKEIDPKTMQSKLVKDLYFAGEIIDVDAYTGGFNLQIAWSTGFVAGKAL